MIRSDILIISVMLSSMVLIPISILIEIYYDVDILSYLQFYWILLLPFIIVRLWFPNSKAYKWFNSVPEKVLIFYKSTYDKIKIY